MERESIFEDKYSANEVDLSLPFTEDFDNVSATPTTLPHEMVLSKLTTFLSSYHSVCDTDLYGFERGPSSTAGHAMVQTVSRHCFNILNL